MFDSNDRLISIQSDSETAQKLHQNSNKVNEQLEVIAAMIVHPETAKDMKSEVQELHSFMSEYNDLLNEINFEEMEDLVKSYYLEPDQITDVVDVEDENDSDDEVDFEIPDTEEIGEDKNIEECDVIVPDTQTQIIPETQNSQNTQVLYDNSRTF